MASTASTNPYAYSKGSELATRTLITGEKPEATTSSASHDHHEAHDRPVLHRKHTDNYEQAAAAAREERREEMSAASSVFERQQSFKMEEKRRQHHEKLFGEEPRSAGYHSTGQFFLPDTLPYRLAMTLRLRK